MKFCKKLPYCSSLQTLNIKTCRINHGGIPTFARFQWWNINNFSLLFFWQKIHFVTSRLDGAGTSLTDFIILSFAYLNISYATRLVSAFNCIILIYLWPLPQVNRAVKIIVRLTWESLIIFPVPNTYLFIWTPLSNLQGST